MTEEWQILGEYVSQVVGNAPAAMREAAHCLQCEFSAGDAARVAKAELFADLMSAGALAEGARDVWDRHCADTSGRLVELLSATAQMDMKVRNAAKRGKSKIGIDHDKDRQVALRAYISEVTGETADLRAVILKAANALGISIIVSDDSYYQRIRRIIADPKERIKSRALVGLHHALRQLQKV